MCSFHSEAWNDTLFTSRFVLFLMYDNAQLKDIDPVYKKNKARFVSICIFSKSTWISIFYINVLRVWNFTDALS